MIILTCETCNTQYPAKPYMARKSKLHFCSSKCYGIWQQAHRKNLGSKKITVTCLVCGKNFERQKSSIRSHMFCSRKCWAQWRSSEAWSGKNNPSWKGGNTRYRGENWNKQSKLTRLRDGDTCQHCRIHSPSLPVHHIIPFHLFDDYIQANNLSNLITLCPTCHSAAEYAFWKDNPESLTQRHFPNCSPLKECKLCHQRFEPRSSFAKVCDNCCTAICLHCGKTFFSRKSVHRNVKYCSRNCRNEAIKREMRICKRCGIEYQPDRNGTKYCSNACRLNKYNAVGSTDNTSSACPW